MATQPEIINELQRALVGGVQHLLEKIPGTLKLVIKQGVWKQCRDRNDEVFTSFEAFAKYPLWWGLASSVDDLLAFCRKRPEIQKLIRAEVGAAPVHVGRGHRSSNTTPNDRGATHALRRLKRDRPELAELVIAGELTANAAAIQAGFRTRTITIPLNPARAATVLRRHFNAKELQQLIQALMDS